MAGNTITGNNSGLGSIRTTKSGLYRVNRIQGNSEFGISTATPAVHPSIDAKYNWWGNSTGPTLRQPARFTGDAITTKVDYFPFFGSIADTDADGMWDEWEMEQFGDLATATAASDLMTTDCWTRTSSSTGPPRRTGTPTATGSRTALKSKWG